MPKFIDKTGYRFNDGTIIREHFFQEETEKNKIEVLVSNLAENKKEIQYSNNFRLIGKLKDLIFFDGGGLPENWLLYVFDIEKEQFAFSTYLAQVMLVDDFLVASKLSDHHQIDSKKGNPCDASLGFFEIYTIQLLKDYPQIQPTKLSYCAYIQ